MTSTRQACVFIYLMRFRQMSWSWPLPKMCHRAFANITHPYTHVRAVYIHMRA